MGNAPLLVALILALKSSTFFFFFYQILVSFFCLFCGFSSYCRFAGSSHCSSISIASAFGSFLALFQV